MMTWDEMTAVLRESGVAEDRLPTRSRPNELQYGLRVEQDKFIVTHLERAACDDIADFPTEAGAAAYVFDIYKENYRLFGDTRLDDAKRGIYHKGVKASDLGGRWLGDSSPYGTK